MFTASDVAAVACITALLIGVFLYKKIKLKNLLGILVNMAMTTATIMMFIVRANIFSWRLSFERIPQMIAGWMTTLTDHSFVFMLLVLSYRNGAGWHFSFNYSCVNLYPIDCQLPN